jgi:hypothetical protein
MSLRVPFLSSLGKGSVKYIPSFVVRQRFSKHFLAEMNKSNIKNLLDPCVCAPVCPPIVAR